MRKSCRNRPAAMGERTAFCPQTNSTACGRRDMRQHSRFWMNDSASGFVTPTLFLPLAGAGQSHVAPFPPLSSRPSVARAGIQVPLPCFFFLMPGYLGPGSAAHHSVLRCARDDSRDTCDAYAIALLAGGWGSRTSAVGESMPCTSLPLPVQHADEREQAAGGVEVDPHLLAQPVHENARALVVQPAPAHVDRLDLARRGGAKRLVIAVADHEIILHDAPQRRQREEMRDHRRAVGEP